VLVKNFLAIFFLFAFGGPVFSQTRFSLSTELVAQRSLQKEQRFWAVGQNVIGTWHFSPKESGYALIGYFAPGSFYIPLVATAKSFATSPQEIVFRNREKIRLKEISFGWRHYLKGAFDVEDTWALYGLVGFGLVYGKASNSFQAIPDTSLYYLPTEPLQGEGHFKRLSLDLGLGVEYPVGDEFFVYAEAKTWIPTTQYPSKYLFVNKNAPLVALASIGVRIIF
jgi:hypothetical protein